MQLKQLGITFEHWHAMHKRSDENAYSIRNNVNGTYRILLHRLQKQSNALERDLSYDKSIHDNIRSTENHKISPHRATNESNQRHNMNQSQAQTAKTCIIL